MEENYATLKIEDIAFPDQYGVGKIEGYAVFVPSTVVGDTALVRIVKKKKNFAYAKLVDIIEPSPHRVNPRCPHFEFCGGCTLQNLTYSQQLELKKNHVLQSLKRIGGIKIPKHDEVHITPSPNQFFYRSKLTLRFFAETDSPALGLMKRINPMQNFKHDVVPVSECPVFAPELKKMIPVFLDYLRNFVKSGKVFNNRFHADGKLILRHSKTTGEYMIVMKTNGLKKTTAENPVKKLKDVFENEFSYFETVEKKLNLLHGKGYIVEKIGNLAFRIRPKAFFQPNPAGAAEMYGKLGEISGLTGSERLLGLYSGIGVIEMCMADRAYEVIGVDSQKENIECADENKKINQMRNCSFIECKAEQILSKLDVRNFDILIIDPPRTGLSTQSANIIRKINPKKMIYISCNPATLARDLRILQKEYSMTHIEIFDFFPHTGHVESLVLLDKTCP